MKSTVVGGLLVMIACVAVICETAAISKHHRAAAADLTRWLNLGFINRRYIIPTKQNLYRILLAYNSLTVYFNVC